MADRVHPSTKPAAAPAAAFSAKVAATNPAFPGKKSQLYSVTRPAYRPQPPPRRRHRRGCCCSCCLWTTLAVVLLILLAGIAGSVFYALYCPQQPSFSVSSLHLSRFNLTDTAVGSALNVTIIARNRNSEIAFHYDRISARVFSGGVEIGDADFPAFTHGAKNVTALRSVISRSLGPFPEGTDVSDLRSSARSRNLAIEIQLETKVSAKIGRVKTKQLTVRVTCGGIRVPIPTGKTASVAKTSNAKCKVDPIIKIMRWTL